MNRAPFTHNPSAWLITPRTGATPAEYAASIERFTPPKRMGLSVFAIVGGLLLGLLAVHFLAR